MLSLSHAMSPMLIPPQKCKGSVYRMSRPNTVDEIALNPRKMRQVSPRVQDFGVV
jgi:hypothetical protein